MAAATWHDGDGTAAVRRYDCNTERRAVRAEVQSNLEVCEQRHERIWRQWCHSRLHKANALLFHSRGAPVVLLRDERRDGRDGAALAAPWRKRTGSCRFRD